MITTSILITSIITLLYILVLVRQLQYELSVEENVAREAIKMLSAACCQRVRDEKDLTNGVLDKLERVRGELAEAKAECDRLHDAHQQALTKLEQYER